MKSAGEVAQKLKQARFRHIKRVLAKAVRTSPDLSDAAKDNLKKELEKTFEGASVSTIAPLYPDVAVLMWVLSDSVDTEDSLMPGATLVGSLGGIPLWADTPEEAVQAQHHLDRLVDRLQEIEGEVSKPWWKRAFSW